jgi:catechol 2,3-dioxygenase-like lactoylglutathione lyase family enzyme
MTTTESLTAVDSVTLEAADPAAAEAFYAAAFGLGPDVVRLRASDTADTAAPASAPTSGFRGFTISLLVAQPATVDELVRTALEAGATPLKAVKKSLWGYGAVVSAPDGSIWKVATSSKKNTGPATRQIDDIALLLGVADVAATKRFYVERGMEVARSFGRKYAEFGAPSGHIKLALYGRTALAKDAGVPAAGAASHGIAIRSGIGPFTDPDGFAWERA